MIWPFRARKQFAMTAPGPSPWYLEAGPHQRMHLPDGEWRWAKAGRSGLCELRSPEDDVVLLLDFQCYVQPLAEGQLLIWKEAGRKPEKKSGSPCITFTLLDPAQLVPIEKRDAAMQAIRSEGKPMFFHRGNARTFTIATTLNEGVHELQTPAEFAHIPELLVLADFGPEEQKSGWDRAYRAIFAFDFRNRRVEVLPQKWFNEAPMDFGYQWITRVQRDAASGRIIGEGVRIRSFRLDASGTQVEEWLRKDAICYPARESI